MMLTQTPEEKKYCGLTKWPFIIVVVLVSVIIGVAITVPISIAVRNSRLDPDVSAGITIVTQSPTKSTGSPSTIPTISPVKSPTKSPLREGETFSPTSATNTPVKAPTMTPSTSTPTESPTAVQRYSWNVNQVNGAYSENGYVLAGVDVVNYFTNDANSPVLGTKSAGVFLYKTTYLGGKFAFFSQDNLNTFLTDPGKYAPRFGGFCAQAMASNYIAGGDPNAWTVYLGKLYINYSTGVRTSWSQNKDNNINNGNINWANRGWSN